MIKIKRDNQVMTCEDGRKILAMYINYPDAEIEFTPETKEEEKLYKQMLFLKNLLETGENEITIKKPKEVRRGNKTN